MSLNSPHESFSLSTILSFSVIRLRKVCSAEERASASAKDAASKYGISFKNENISAGSSLLVKNVSSTEMPDFIRAVLASCAAFIKRQPMVFTPDFARVRSISVSLMPGARMIRSFMVVSFQNH